MLKTIVKWMFRWVIGVILFWVLLAVGLAALWFFVVAPRVADGLVVGSSDPVFDGECGAGAVDRPVSVAVLYMTDVGVSLEESIPTSRRSEAVRWGLNELRGIHGSFGGGMDIVARVDGFADRYYAGTDVWFSAGAGFQAEEALGVLQPGELRSFVTDYGAGLRAAAAAFKEGRAVEADCKLLVMFSDGGHTGADSFSALCSGPVAELADIGVSFVGVLGGVAADGAGADVFERFASGDCDVADFEAVAFRGEWNGAMFVLGRVAGEFAGAASNRSPANSLPGTVGVPVVPAVVGSGSGTPADPCWAAVNVEPTVVGFRLLFDFGSVRGVRSAEDVVVAVQPPGVGERLVLVRGGGWSSPVVGERLVDIGGASRSAMPRSAEFVAHEAIPGFSLGGGDWRVWLWGAAAGAERDACLVGVASETVTAVEAAAFSRLDGAVGPDGKLTLRADRGAVAAGYDSIGLLLSLVERNAGSSTVFPMDVEWCALGRPLTSSDGGCGAVPSARDAAGGQSTVLELESFWDAVERSVESRGGLGVLLGELGVGADPVLEVRAVHSDVVAGHPVSWERPLGFVEVSGIAEALERRARWDVADSWAGLTRALPFYSAHSFDVFPKEETADGLGVGELVVDVVVERGFLPSTVTVGEAYSTSPNEDGAASAVAEVQSGWVCVVPGIVADPFGAPGGEQPSPVHKCPSLTVGLGEFAADIASSGGIVGFVERRVVFDFSVGSDFEGAVRLLEPPPSAPCDVLLPGDCPDKKIVSARDLSSRLAARAATQDSAFLDLSNGEVVVEVRVPAETALSSEGGASRIAVVAFLMAALVGASRVVGWARLRKWSPVRTGAFTVFGLDSPVELTRQVGRLSEELAIPATRATVGPVRLRVRKRDLLLGRERKIVCETDRRGCIGPGGWYENRGGKRVGVVGSRLAGGWVLVAGTPTSEPRLVVWDLPSTKSDTLKWIEKVRADARAASDAEFGAVAVSSDGDEMSGVGGSWWDDDRSGMEIEQVRLDDDISDDGGGW